VLRFIFEQQLGREKGHNKKENGKIMKEKSWNE
jgi:hypothetical protein